MKKTLLECIISAISDKKGEKIMAYDFHEISPFVEYVVIASAGNLRQVHAIAHNIADEVRKEGYELSHIEGDDASRWILVDANDVIVHVFLDEERDVYQLERLYCDIPQVLYDL